MTIKAQTMGPGTFSIGAVGSPLDLTAQVTKCAIVPKASAEDPTPTLSGESLAGERTYAWTVSATVIQDLTEAGMFDYTWSHKGQQVPFEFVPSTAAGRTVSGIVTVDPIQLGGDVKKKNTSDLEWEIVGDPVLGTDL